MIDELKKVFCKDCKWFDKTNENAGNTDGFSVDKPGLKACMHEACFETRKTVHPIYGVEFERIRMFGCLTMNHGCECTNYEYQPKLKVKDDGVATGITGRYGTAVFERTSEED